jgi:predicted TIM-barrel fold metal-dependent hydrolase
VTLDLGSIGTPSYQTDAVRSILERHTSLRVVIAHLGHPPPGQSADGASLQAWLDQLQLARTHNVWFDLAALPIYWPAEDYPYATARDCLRQAVEIVGPERLLWGTDVPGLLSYATYEQLLGFLTRHCDFLSPTDLDKVLGANAWEVYGGADTTSG